MISRAPIRTFDNLPRKAIIKLRVVHLRRSSELKIPAYHLQRKELDICKGSGHLDVAAYVLEDVGGDVQKNLVIVHLNGWVRGVQLIIKGLDVSPEGGFWHVHSSLLKVDQFLVVWS